MVLYISQNLMLAVLLEVVLIKKRVLSKKANKIIPIWNCHTMETFLWGGGDKDSRNLESFFREKALIPEFPELPISLSLHFFCCFLEKKTTCSPNPCNNGGHCLTDGTNFFQCLCINGTTGKFCEGKPLLSFCS